MESDKLKNKNDKLKTAMLAVLAFVFVVATSLLTIQNFFNRPLSVARFDWPDEMATAYFAERITDGLPIASYDDTIALAGNRLHPRSINVRNSALVPGGFPGFAILLGFIGTLFGYEATFLITPLLGVAAVYALVAITRRVFNDQIAWTTGVLAFTSPALLYYTSYVMLPNVAFVSLALCGVALALTSRWRFFGGVLVGLALFVRPNEIIWLLPVFLISLIPPLSLPPALQRGEIQNNFLPLAEQGGGLRWGMLLEPILGLIVGFAPTFVANTMIYGHPFATGYNRFVEATASAASPLEFSGNFLLPFGIHPRLIATNLWHSGIKIFWWLVIPAACGLWLWWRSGRAARNSELIYVVATVSVSVWLVLYYGSWPFTDVEILSLNTIGRSYVRYWLPVFLLMLPFVALFLRWVWSYPPLHLPAGRQVSSPASERGETQKGFLPLAEQGGGFRWGIRHLTASLLFVIITLLSVRLVYWARPESIIPVAKRIQTYHNVRSMVETYTPRDAIIVTERTDKIIFPERRVVEGSDAELRDVIARVRAPWYVLVAESDAPDIPLSFEPVERQAGLGPVRESGFALYHIIK